jgi:[histone H3]-lysine79 N-trimethyltransferase
MWGPCRYDLVFGKEKINPTEEIIEVAGHVTDVYLTSEQAKPFKEPNTGIIRQLTKAKNLLSRDVLNKDLLDGFKDAVDVYNSAISGLIKDGALARNLDSTHHLPLEMIKCILRQVYDRAVSPKVDILKKRRENAENEKDNTYGELLPMFVSKALAKAGLKSDQVFVDLGSGVGNVVLQAALEFGCESFGCEMMENACELAEAQQKEFAARCRLWGLETGKVQLERGNFFESQATHAAIKKADVILVNNEVFSSDTNGNLISLFLDCKDGCKIVSLQPFVEPGHEITDRNLYDPANQLDVEQCEYHRGYVSWKDAGGDYFISTKDRKRLEAFEKQA